MIKTLIPFVFCVGLLVVGVEAQRPKKKPVTKPPADFSLGVVAKPVNYHFRFFIDSDDRLSCRVGSTTDARQLAFSDLADLTTSLLNNGDILTRERFEHPKFVLAADPSVKLSDVLLTLGKLKQFESQIVELEAADDLLLRVVNRPRVNNELSVFPNPLFLLLQMDRGGNLTLNNEPHGKFPEIGKLAMRLKEIFKAREDNGVFRDGVNEIEKTVRLQIYSPGVTFQTLIKLATAIRDVGGDRIEFDMDGIEPTLARLPLISQ